VPGDGVTATATPAPASGEPAVLAAIALPAAEYDVALLDLDGVLYVGSEPVPGAAEALVEVASRGMRLAYVTNNASRRPVEVAALLSSMEVPATPEEVVTSAQAAGDVLRRRLPRGSSVLVVGTEALAEEVRAVGLVAVRTGTPVPAAVVQGYGPDTCWRDLAEAAVAVRGGAFWLATNTDSTLPSARGPLPGNGALVAAVRVATGAEPDVAGKPRPSMHRTSVERTGARKPLVVGDRLDTDVEGAVAAGADSMLVLTGVTTPDMLIAAHPGQRPTYVAAHVRGLVQPHPSVSIGRDEAKCRGFTARRDAAMLALSGSGTDPLDALRALCGAAWVDQPAPEAIRASGPAAVAALRELGITAADED
jgi:glycerol 3-phosphatase-2